MSQVADQLINNPITSTSDPITIVWTLGGLMVVALMSLAYYQERQKTKKDDLIKEKDRIIMETALLLKDFIHEGEKSTADIKSVDGKIEKVLTYTIKVGEPKLEKIVEIVKEIKENNGGN